MKHDYFHVIVISGLSDLTYTVMYYNFEPLQWWTNTSPEDLIERLTASLYGGDPARLLVTLNRDNKHSTLNQPVSVWSKFVEAGFTVEEGHSSFEKYGLDQKELFNC